MHTIRLCLFILFMVALAPFALPQFALPDAQAQTPPTPGGPKQISWPGSPLACLPDRAERWEDEDEMEPCHCPPPDYCPDVSAIEPEDLKFYVSFRAVCGPVEIRKCEVDGAEVADALQDIIDSGEVFTSYNAVGGVIRNLVRQRCKGHDMLNRREQCGNGATVGGKAWADVTLDVAVEMNDALNDWANDALRLPVSLASRCCDSICPAGLTPEIQEIEVDVHRYIGEGTGTQEACDDATDDVDELQEDVDELQEEVDDLRDAAQDACNPPTGGPGSDCDDAVDAYRDKDDELDDLKDDLDDLEETQGTACDIPEQITETITIETVKCGTVKTFHREGCMIEGTQITMADGSTKGIEDLKLGDMVKGNHGPAPVKALNKFTQDEDWMYSINDGEAFFTIEHPILTKRGWKSVDSKVTSTKTSDTKIIGTLEVGDEILTAGEPLKVEKIEKKTITGGVSAYNLKVGGDGSFIANGIIMKGFEKVQMHY